MLRISTFFCWCLIVYYVSTCSQLVIFYSVCAVIPVSLCEFKCVILGCLILVADHVKQWWWVSVQLVSLTWFFMYYFCGAVLPVDVMYLWQFLVTCFYMVPVEYYHLVLYNYPLTWYNCYMYVCYVYIYIYTHTDNVFMNFYLCKIWIHNVTHNICLT